jgi:uncharacterized protein YecT (DUF1311 family)
MIEMQRAFVVANLADCNRIRLGYLDSFSLLLFEQCKTQRCNKRRVFPEE